MVEVPGETRIIRTDFCEGLVGICARHYLRSQYRNIPQKSLGMPLSLLGCSMLGTY